MKKDKIQFSEFFQKACVIQAYVLQAHLTQDPTIINFVEKVSEDLLKDWVLDVSTKQIKNTNIIRVEDAYLNENKHWGKNFETFSAKLFFPQEHTPPTENSYIQLEDLSYAWLRIVSASLGQPIDQGTMYDVFVVLNTNDANAYIPEYLLKGRTFTIYPANTQ